MGRFTLNITVGSEAWSLDLEQDCEIGPDLDVEFRNHAQRIRPWLTLHAEAQDEVARLTVDLDVLYAQTDEQKRNEAAQQGIPLGRGGLTEKMVENMVKTDPKYRELQQKLLDAKRNVLHLAAGVKTMDHRLQMLIGLGANWREELKGDPQMREDRQMDRMRERYRREPTTPSKP